MRPIIFILIATTLILACKNQGDQNTSLFRSLSSDQTGLDFNNQLTVNDSMNFFTYGYFYMGGGVAAGDINNDGLSDLYFTGNMVPNQLYLNKGQLEFDNISKIAGVTADDRWITGCAMHDINADGLLDIYISVAGKWKPRKNILYVNQGNDQNGIPRFVDQAEEYGLADEGNSIQATFLDYDNDGDIDVFVANYEITSFNLVSTDYKKLINEVTDETSDHLYRNNGDNSFTDVTREAGVLSFGLTVGVMASDFNNDGFTDLYLSNDFNTPDYFYLNNGDGTFSEVLQDAVQHTSFYGMGIDAADYNNDGMLDIAQMDMTPADNFRSKANMASMDITGFWNNVNQGFHHQYMYNTLQVGMGIRDNGIPFYSDVAKMMGMDKTDWSWSVLFADYDNDGLKDVYITNGTRKDINNKDFFKWLERIDISLKVKYKELSVYDLMKKMPSKKVDNYAFKNINGNGFQNVNDSWDIHFEGFSNGATYVDLDNDGDLELVTNNIDATCSIFENRSETFANSNFLRVELKGPPENPLGLGARIELQMDSATILHEQTLVRGFQSSVDPIVHYGLGSAKEISELNIFWPDGSFEQLENVSANKLLQLKYSNARIREKEHIETPHMLVDVSDAVTPSEIRHTENDFNDFNREVLLPHKMSHFGPALAVGDVNKDGLDDFYLGGSIGTSGRIVMQDANGQFNVSDHSISPSESKYEDVDAVFSDFDSDGDLDLLVVSGGNEYESGSIFYKDRIFENDGNGIFKKVEDALPSYAISGSCAILADYDGDGDEDIFIGGRQVPGKYPLPTSSKILRNISDSRIKFEDITDTVSPVLNDIGMVTHAQWDDLDRDGDLDLIVTGEWMPITILVNSGNNTWTKMELSDLSSSVGWWNSIKGADFDNDGDTDFIIGNLGLNYKYKANIDETFDVYAHDYDDNGKLDIVLGYYQEGEQFPVRGKQCSAEQIPDLDRKFTKYDNFAAASLSDIYTPELLGEAVHYKAQNFANSYLENLGDHKYRLTNLPSEMQTSTINSIKILDLNGDGSLDVIAGGNFFQSEVETPRNDASFGWVLQGDGTGKFDILPFSTTGLYMPYDNRQIELISTERGRILLFANNDGPLKSFLVKQ